MTQINQANAIDYDEIVRYARSFDKSKPGTVGHGIVSDDVKISQPARKVMDGSIDAMPDGKVSVDEFVDRLIASEVAYDPKVQQIRLVDEIHPPMPIPNPNQEKAQIQLIDDIMKSLARGGSVFSAERSLVALAQNYDLRPGAQVRLVQAADTFRDKYSHFSAVKIVAELARHRFISSEGSLEILKFADKLDKNGHQFDAEKIRTNLANPHKREPRQPQFPIIPIIPIFPGNGKLPPNAGFPHPSHPPVPQTRVRVEERGGDLYKFIEKENVPANTEADDFVTEEMNGTAMGEIESVMPEDFQPFTGE